MIGYYNYTVVLTFMSLICAILGMAMAIQGAYVAPIVCLALSGFFDMLDGPVARTKTDRSDDERLYGIQLDSLCDVIAFGVLPAIICYCEGVEGPIGFVALFYFVICGVVRLCYFNVRETNNFFSEEHHEKVFIGLPITAISVIFPLVFPLSLILTEHAFSMMLTFMLLVVGTLYIANFEMKKPSKKTLITLCTIVFLVLLVFAILKFPHLDFFTFI